MSQYELIARVIRYLDDHHAEQPSLDTLARQAALSPSHFHRLFTSWAGVTPKDFVQCLTLEHAKARLRVGQNVLAAALDAGLSGPGRLHDLCVNLAAASPGEWKRGGEGWTIRVGFADTPFGRCLIGESPRGVCHLAFLDPNEEAAALAEVQTAWPAAGLARDDRAADRIAAQIFAPAPDGNTKRPLQAFVRGTEFQIHVWRALLRVGPGELTSYGRLAAAIGTPTAARAVGAAVGRNPLAYLIPCHRVIRETGVVGEYRWSAVRKRAMLAWEAASRSEQPRAVTRPRHHTPNNVPSSGARIDTVTSATG